MKRNQKPDPKSTADRELSPSRSQSPRRPFPEIERSSAFDVPKNGLRVTTFRTSVAGPPTLDYVENDGRHIKEEQCLVGSVEAPFNRKSVLEGYGIDLRYAIHNPKTNRWERCLFSHTVADMLEELSAQGEFPFAFEATPSEAEVDWADLKTHVQTARAMLPLKAYLTPATPVSLSAVMDDDRIRERRGSPREEASIGTGNVQPK